jgi:hypothetical protein
MRNIHCSMQVCNGCQFKFRNETQLKIHTRKAIRGELQKCDGVLRDAQHTLLADCHTTPMWMWKELIGAYPAIARAQVWDPFYHDGKSKMLMQRAGFMKVRTTKVDFFEQVSKWKYDIIVSNPPFSIKKRIMQELFEADRPFILLLPVVTLLANYFFKHYRKKCKLIFPSNRFMDEQVRIACVFICFKCGPRRTLTWV